MNTHSLKRPSNSTTVAITSKAAAKNVIDNLIKNGDPSLTRRELNLCLSSILELIEYNKTEETVVLTFVPVPYGTNVTDSIDRNVGFIPTEYQGWRLLEISTMGVTGAGTVTLSVTVGSNDAIEIAALGSAAVKTSYPYEDDEVTVNAVDVVNVDTASTDGTLTGVIVQIVLQRGDA